MEQNLSQKEFKSFSKASRLLGQEEHTVPMDRAMDKQAFARQFIKKLKQYPFDRHMNIESLSGRAKETPVQDM
jgi:hypothetical protein